MHSHRQRGVLRAVNRPNWQEMSGVVLVGALLAACGAMPPASKTSPQVQSRSATLYSRTTSTTDITNMTTSTTVPTAISTTISTTTSTTVSTTMPTTMPTTTVPPSGSRALGSVVVHLETQHATLYGPDGAVLAEVPISSGAGGRTPRGQFYVQGRTRVGTSGSAGNVHMDFAVWFNGNIGFHGIPWVGDRSRRLTTPLGVTPVSHGCIRMEDEVAAWLYDALPTGSPVIVTS